jgi:hypothetical protein
MVATNKQLLISKSHGDLNWCTPCRGKPNQHATYAQRTLPAGGPHTWHPFMSHQQGWTDALLPRKSAPDSTSQPSWVVHGTSLSFSPNTTIEAVRLSQAPVVGRLLGLPGPYHWHVIGTFNTCSRLPTSRSLTDVGGGYHIENLRIATVLSPPFPSEGSTDPPNGQPSLRLSTPHFTTRTGDGTQALNLMSGNLPSTHSTS